MSDGMKGTHIGAGGTITPVVSEGRTQMTPSPLITAGANA